MAGRLPAALKERGISLVLNELERGTNVSRACREVGVEIGMNPNTLRRLVAETRRSSAIAFPNPDNQQPTGQQ